PTLLNSGDIIQLSVLLSQYDGEIKSDTRIEGVSEVKQISAIRLLSEKERKIRERTLFSILYLLLIFSSLVWVIFATLIRNSG
ncbi:MAG: hypothetical protein AAF485_16855, partial [Chloroflexota bacterium]